MAAKSEHKFTVISNTNYENREIVKVTNPICKESDYLRTKLMKFQNNEGGKKLLPEDLLKW